ncbi:MAG TPA: quinoprotein dehydrogenase-associated putative ABC transporter substrate-binding protein [Rhizomicrobium sp.]|nr:quinoprotein dehydrogenase-associated putative ABC transporter substrate-binding protein [Rhizomicrobium sp.]
MRALPLGRRLAGSVAAAMLAAATAAAAAEGPSGPDSGALAVCADPGNLPYSSAKLDGFENKVAALLAADMHRTLRYAWAPERRNFFSRTLFAHACDVVISVPASLPLSMPAIATTRPWFTSTYVAVTRAEDGRVFSGFDDPWLKSARIGVQLVSGGDANTPPAMALSRRGITGNVTGFSPWDSEEDGPQAKIVDAVAHKSIDIALVWGPFGGYFAKPYGDALKVEAIVDDPGSPGLVFAFPMAAAVRKEDEALKAALQAAFDRNAQKIAAILKDDNIPIAQAKPAAAAPGAQSSTLTQ